MSARSAVLLATLPMVFSAVYLGGFLFVASRLRLDRQGWAGSLLEQVTDAASTSEGTPFAFTFLWGTAWVIFGLLLAVTCGVALVVAWRSMPPWRSAPPVLRWAWVMVIVLVFVAGADPRESEEVRVSSGGRPATQLKRVLEQALGQPRLHVLTEGETRLTYLAVGWVALACSILLWSSVLSAADQKRLAAHIRWTHGLLNVATACLVAGVAQVFLLYAWPAQYLPAPSRAPVLTFAKGIALTAGTNYTMLLLAMFLPLLLVQRELARKLVTERLQAPSTEPAEDIETLRTQLDLSFIERLKTWGTLLAPLATSLFSLLSASG